MIFSLQLPFNNTCMKVKINSKVTFGTQPSGLRWSLAGFTIWKEGMGRGRNLIMTLVQCLKWLIIVNTAAVGDKNQHINVHGIPNSADHLPCQPQHKEHNGRTAAIGTQFSPQTLQI